MTVKETVLFVIAMITAILFIRAIGSTFMAWYVTHTDEGKLMDLRDRLRGKLFTYDWIAAWLMVLIAVIFFVYFNHKLI